MSEAVRHLAIVGGGFSGAMLAARLAERGVACSLIDRTGAFGPGLAYSTPFERHLLNVRADRMIKARRARLDPVGVGLDLDAGGRLLAADGSTDERLFALGPPARAAFWETTAVPDIRKRIEDLVDRLAACQTIASR